MPSAFSTLDTSFPGTTGGTTEQKLQAVQDYLYQLLEQLRYTLNNICPDNFNETEVNGWAGETIVKPIHAEITDVETGLKTYIDVTAAGVMVDVQKESAVEWAANTPYYILDVVKLTAENNSASYYKCIQNHTSAAGNKPPNATYWEAISAADILHTRFDITAEGLRSEVSRATEAEGSLSSSITQTADAITLAAQRTYAPLWDSSATYYKDNFVRTEATSGGHTTVKYYKALKQSTNKAPATQASYWTEVSSADVLNSRFQVTANAITAEVTRATGAEETLSSTITQTADGIRSDVSKVTPITATAWANSTNYAVGNYVKVDTTQNSVTTTAYYQCTQAHISDSAKKPGTAGGADYWKPIPAQNAMQTQMSSIDQKADNIQLQVTGASAPEWAVGTTYAKDTVVKVTTAAAGSTAQSIAYYKAESAHTAAANNKPGTTGGDAVWESTTAPNVQSMIDLSLDGLTLEYDSGLIGYSEWTEGTVYEKDAVVSVTSNGVTKFYKAKSTHTATVNNDPPSARWELTTEPTEHNGAFIKLMKDGTYIGGGKVFVKDLDASTITTGTLNAKNIILLDSFSVHVIDRNGQEQNCGTIGGDYASTSDESAIEINSSNSKQYVRITDGYITIISDDSSGNESFNTWISLEPDHVEIGAYDYPGGGANEISKTLIIDKNGIYIRDGFAGRKHDLFDLF